ncbi:hypothetical protein [Tenggerimyces flavus]|uniref:Uncharacterized protein n=1 Tax=Tenggerimyces flavus TaxID=1708749 RepID=A0ABV7Y9P9_9ACTN|nr:hypothetical protein [Tenggerimyces flavus]MBM7788896.1 MFS family permease [Tenggerimyces flavus]
MTWRTKLKVAAVLAALAFGAILAGFFGDRAHADVPSPAYQRPPIPPVVDGPSEPATFAAIVLTGAFLVFVAGWLLYGWLKNRRERAEKFNAAAEALRRNRERNIARDVNLTDSEREQFLDIVTEWRKGVQS